jgi:hypothetical protein
VYSESGHRADEDEPDTCSEDDFGPSRSVSRAPSRPASVAPSRTHSQYSIGSGAKTPQCRGSSSGRLDVVFMDTVSHGRSISSPQQSVSHSRSQSHHQSQVQSVPIEHNHNYRHPRTRLTHNRTRTCMAIDSPHTRSTPRESTSANARFLALPRVSPHPRRTSSATTRSLLRPSSRVRMLRSPASRRGRGERKRWQRESGRRWKGLGWEGEGEGGGWRIERDKVTDTRKPRCRRGGHQGRGYDDDEFDESYGDCGGCWRARCG